MWLVWEGFCIVQIVIQLVIDGPILQIAVVIVVRRLIILHVEATEDVAEETVRPTVLALTFPETLNLLIRSYFRCLILSHSFLLS